MADKDIYLERINTVPLQSEDFSQDFESWLSLLVDSMNSVLQTVEEKINGLNYSLPAPNYTLAEIMARLSNAPNGSIWYDTDNHQLVAKINGALTVIA